LGDTNAVAFTTDSPACASRSISPILTAVGTLTASFCKPSRGPILTIFTWPGKSIFSILFLLRELFYRGSGAAIIYQIRMIHPSSTSRAPVYNGFFHKFKVRPDMAHNYSNE
jgi:hypothetical protein